MDYPEFNKRIGEKIAILTFPGIIKCATEAFKLLINFQFIILFLKSNIQTNYSKIEELNGVI